MSIKISVIVPVYNMEKYLERCLDSICNQSYDNLDILLVDDGSTDKSLSILYEYMKKDNRIRVFEKENGGQASARNYGLKHMIGDYVSFVDSDDYLEINCLEICVNQLNENDYDLIIFDSNYIKGNKVTHVKSGLGMVDSTPSSCNKLFKVGLWEQEEFPINFWYEDLGIIPFIVTKSKLPVKIDEPLYNYLSDRDDSQTHSYDINKLTDTIDMVENVKRKLITSNSYGVNEEDFHSLVLEHLLTNTILLKFLFVKDTKERKILIDKVRIYLDNLGINWLEEYKKKNKGINKLKYLGIKNYFDGNFFLGDFFWVIPNKIKGNI